MNRATQAELRELAPTLYRYLREHGYGAKHPVEAKRLATALGMPPEDRKGLSAGTRVWSAVKFAVNAGYLICGGPGGYYVPASRDEVDRTSTDLKSRAKAMLARAKAIDAMAAEQFGG